MDRWKVAWLGSGSVDVVGGGAMAYAGGLHRHTKSPLTGVGVSCLTILVNPLVATA